MGLIFSSVLSQLFGKKEVRILILGLDNAGKTTILYKLYAPGKVTRTTPTVGFNIEQIQHKNLCFSMWDLGGQTNIRPFWRCYIGNTSAVIYVIDSADRERIGLAKKELYNILAEEEMAKAHLLVFANKQDQVGALTDIEVAKELGLPSLKDRKWFICKTNAIKGTGLQTGLDWLADAVLGNETAIADIEPQEEPTPGTSDENTN